MRQVLPALLTLLVTQILVSSSALVAPVLAPLAAITLGVDPANVGYFVSCLYVLGASAGLASGGLIARFGPIRVTQIGLTLCGVGLACAAAGSLWTLPLAAVAIGMGVGPSTPSSSQILARITPPAVLNFAFSLKQTGVPLGSAFAGLVMPALAVRYGWQAAALTSTGLCLAMALALQPLRRRYDGQRNPWHRLHAGGQLLEPLRMVLTSSAIRRLTLVAFVYNGMQTCVATFLVVYLVQRAALDVVQAGLILSLAQVAAAVARISSGTLADRYFSPERVLGSLGLLSALSAVAVTAITPAWPYAALLAVCAVLGTASTGWNGVYLAQVARLAPPGRAGEVTGGVTFMTFGGVVVMPALFSTILAFSDSYALGFLVVAVPTFIAGLATLLRPPAAVA